MNIDFGVQLLARDHIRISPNALEEVNIQAHMF